MHPYYPILHFHTRTLEAVRRCQTVYGVQEQPTSSQSDAEVEETVQDPEGGICPSELESCEPEQTPSISPREPRSSPCRRPGPQTKTDFPIPRASIGLAEPRSSPCGRPGLQARTDFPIRRPSTSLYYEPRSSPCGRPGSQAKTGRSSPSSPSCILILRIRRLGATTFRPPLTTGANAHAPMSSMRPPHAPCPRGIQISFPARIGFSFDR